MSYYVCIDVAKDKVDSLWLRFSDAIEIKDLCIKAKPQNSGSHNDRDDIKRSLYEQVITYLW